MYCHKCGCEAPEGSMFCVKCGERLIVEENPPATTTYGQPPPANINVPKQKSKKPIFIIAGVAIAAALALIFVFAILPRINNETEPYGYADQGNEAGSDEYADLAEEAATDEQIYQEEEISTIRPEVEAALLLYIDVLNEIRRTGEWSRDWEGVSLAYIDNDDIPELVADWGITALGCRIYTVINGELVYVHGSVGGLLYIERQNIFLRSGGRMGYYHDIIYTIDDGDFAILHEGYWTEMGVFTWNSEDVTYEEYTVRLEAVFDRSSASCSFEQAVTPEEMIVIINGLLGIQKEERVDTSGWQTANTDFGVFSIPPTWNHYSWGENNGFHVIIGEGNDGWVSMYIVEMGGSLQQFLNASVSSQEFIFDDGHTGVMLRLSDNTTIWIREDWWAALELPYLPSLIDNEATVMAIAGSFRGGTHMLGSNDHTPFLISQLLDYIDGFLVIDWQGERQGQQTVFEIFNAGYANEWWFMYGRAGDEREVFPIIEVEGDIVYMGFPNTDSYYTFFPDGSGLFEGDELTWQVFPR